MSLIDTIRQTIQQELRNYQTKTSPIPYHVHNGLDTAKIPWQNLQGYIGYYSSATTTNGTTTVNVFATTQFPITIKGIYLVSNDTTAGNITVKEAGNTVATIAKGTTSGALVGATSLSNTSVKQGSSLTVVSSSAGNATVFITFTTP